MTIGFVYTFIFGIMNVLGKYYFHSTNEKTESQRGQKTCSSSHSKLMTETVAEHGSPDSLVFLYLHQRVVSGTRSKVDPGSFWKGTERSQL